MDFRELYERVGDSGRAELLDHMMSPFELMHDVITNRDDEWNFEDEDISIFTYVSLLGTGFIDAFIVFLLQIAMPVILFMFYTSESLEDDGVSVGTREMLFTVLFYYLFKVNRGEFTNM